MKVMLYSNGIGPLERKGNIKKTKKILDKVMTHLLSFQQVQQHLSDLLSIKQIQAMQLQDFIVLLIHQKYQMKMH